MSASYYALIGSSNETGEEVRWTVTARNLEQDIIALGGRLLIIETSTRPDYEPARRFYLAHHCRQEAIIEDFYHPGDGLVLFSKKINPPDLTGFKNL